MTFWQRSRLYSPLLVRLLARHKRGRPLTDDEIVKSIAGLSHFEVRTLSWQTEWAGVSVDTMQLYQVACRCDFESREDMKRISQYLRTDPNFDYLRSDPQWKDRWLPMLVAWRDSFEHMTFTTPQLRRLAQRLTPLIRGRQRGPEPDHRPRQRGLHERFPRERAQPAHRREVVPSQS